MRFINQVGCVQRVQRDVCIDVGLVGIHAVVALTVRLDVDAHSVHGYRAVRMYLDGTSRIGIDVDRT